MDLITPVHGTSLPARLTLTASGTTPDPIWGSRDPAFEAEVFRLVNDHRRSLGLVELTQQAQLAPCAGWKALHMTYYNYMDHNDPAPPVARSAGQRYADFGYSGGSWGENIAYGYTTPASVMSGWLGSPGHRANIERSNYRALGVGVARKPTGQWAWVQCFGDKGGTPPPPPPPVQTNKQIADAVVAALKLTTISYPDWKRRVDRGLYKDVKVTQWWKAFDLLSRIQ